MSDFYFTETQDRFALYYSPQCDSTNYLVRQLLPSYGTTGPLMLYTYHQTTGRGQGNNTWESEPGKNLALTLALNISPYSNQLILLNKAITLGVCKAISQLSGIDAAIKWPNDIMLNNKKICGLLLENFKYGKETFLLTGIGINVNQQHWKGDFVASSLNLETGIQYELIKVIHEVIKYICYYLNDITKNTIEQLNTDFNIELWQKDRFILLDLDNEKTVEAKILEVDDLGRLVFEDKSLKINKMHHGQVKISKNNSFFFKG